jgi:ABC-type sugar transport system ATPase subunit
LRVPAAARKLTRRNSGGGVLASVALRGIGKRFGRTVLFDNFALDVQDGELLCLLGPSGSGKTTLMRLIAGLEPLDQGEIVLAGRDIARLPPRARHIGMMFQGYALYPHLSVRGNLAYPLRVRGTGRADIAPRVAEVARLLGIGHLLDRGVQQISGGEQQRVAIGRAIVQQPSLYLLDEPISNLDTSLREQVRTEIRRLQQQLRATMIMVTHDQLDALAIADRIAVLRGGVLQQVGAPEALYRAPANVFVAGFIGQLRMNLLPGRAEAGVLHGDGFLIPLPRADLPQQVTVGFRPEAAELAQGGTPALVEAVQFQGERLVCALRLGAQAVQVALDPGARVMPGETVSLRIRPDRAHLFDTASGARLANNEIREEPA